MRRILISFVFFISISLTAIAENQAKVIELILDASGSMNAKLPDGGTRIEAARQAVSKIVTSLPADTQLSFRVYGHQSPREKHDCNDTQLVIPFGNHRPVAIRLKWARERDPSRSQKARN